MKRIGITQRVELIENLQEKRDCLDIRWSDFLNKLRYIPFPIPNNPSVVKNIIESRIIDGFIFSGGDNINTDAAERNLAETIIMEHVITHKIPLLGICRGMQMILNYFGFRLNKVDHPINICHEIDMEGKTWLVNSFHHYGTTDAFHPLVPLAKAHDGVIEAIRHHSLPIYGIMWHPERNSPSYELDRHFFEVVFNR